MKKAKSQRPATPASKGKPVVKSSRKRPEPGGRRVESAATGASGAVVRGLDPVLEALAGIRAQLADLQSRGQTAAAPASTVASQDESDAMRRAVSDLIERRLEQIVRDLVAIRNGVSALAGSDAVLMELDALLERMGVIRYEARPGDHMDPLIHAVGREASEPAQPNGVIVGGIRPGFRTLRGVVLAKATVVVNRRD